MKKIVVFTGAGISAESGITTFRDSNGLWENFKIDEVATPQGWSKDRSKVLDFYNARRRQMPTVEPNDAHRALVALENEYEVTIVTQNVDDLHERAGSSKIYHLHGELTKARSSFAMNNPSVVASQPVYDIGYEDINLGDKDEDGCQLRPHIVWFGEYPFNIDESYTAFMNADLILVIGTSLQISYTLSFFQQISKETPVIYIDPKPMRYLDNYNLNVEYIEKNAVEGVGEIVNRLIIQAIGSDKNDK